MRDRTVLLLTVAAAFCTGNTVALTSHGEAARIDRLSAELAEVREELTNCRARAQEATPQPAAREDLCVPQRADAAAREESRRKQAETATCLAAGGGCAGCCPSCTPYVEHVPSGSEGNETDECYGESYCRKTDAHTHVELRGDKCVCYASDAELSYVKFFLTTHADCLYARGNHIKVKGRGGDDVIVLEDPQAFSQPDPSAGLCDKLYHRDPVSQNQVHGGPGDDYVVAEGNWNLIWLDAGDDFAQVVGDDSTVRAGLGDDVVEVHGAANEVHGGPGDDTLTATGGDVLSLDNRKHVERSALYDYHPAIGSPNKLWGGEEKFDWYPDERDYATPCHGACHWAASAGDSCNEAACLDTVEGSRRLDGSPFPFLHEGTPWPHEFTRAHWMEDPFRQLKRGPVHWADRDIDFADQCPWTERFDRNLDDYWGAHGIRWAERREE